MNVGQIRAQALRYMRQTANNAFEDDELDDFLQLANDLLRAEIVNYGGAHRLVSNVAITIPAAQDIVTLSSLSSSLVGYKDILAVRDETNSNQRTPVDFTRAARDETDLYQQGVTFTQDSLLLKPQVGEAKTWRIFYMAREANFSADSDTPVLDADFHFVLALQTAQIASAAHGRRFGLQPTLDLGINQLRAWSGSVPGGSRSVVRTYDEASRI